MCCTTVDRVWGIHIICILTKLNWERWPQKWRNFFIKLLLCVLNRPRTTSLAVSCWNSPWQSVPTFWPLALHYRKSVKGAKTSFQLTTPPSPAFTYSQPGRGCSLVTNHKLFWLIFFIIVAHQKMLLIGSMNCQMACYWLRRLWQGSLPFTQVGKLSSHYQLNIGSFLNPAVFFLQW